MDAYVTVRYRLSNICDERDLDGQTFEELVRMLVAEEGVIGLADDVAGEVIAVERA